MNSVKFNRVAYIWAYLIGNCKYTHIYEYLYLSGSSEPSDVSEYMFLLLATEAEEGRSNGRQDGAEGGGGGGVDCNIKKLKMFVPNADNFDSNVLSTHISVEGTSSPSSSFAHLFTFLF